MSEVVERVTQEALDLELQERAELAYKLIRSLEEGPEEPPEDVERAWREELPRRVADFNSGRVKSIPWDEAEAQLREALAKNRQR